MATGYKFTQNKKEGSQIEFEIEVEGKRFNAARDAAYERLAPDTKISGFRPGKAPRKMIEAKLGARLFEEAINRLIPEITSEVVAETQIKPLDYAEYRVGEVKPDFGFQFTATFTVLPEVKLPDFKKLKVKRDEAKVEPKQVTEMFEKLKDEIRAKKNPKSSQPDQSSQQNQPDKQEAKKDSSKENVKEKEKKSEKSKKPVKSTEKATINWAEEFADESLQTADDVKQRLRENLERQAEQQADEKYTNDLIQSAVELANIETPQKLVDQHVEQRTKDYVGRLEELGLEVAEFLKTQNTDLDTLKKSWAEEAEFQVATDILFLSIADANDIVIKREEVDAEVEKVEDTQMRREYSTEAGRNQIATVLMRQKALQIIRDAIEPKEKSSKSTKKS